MKNLCWPNQITVAWPRNRNNLGLMVEDVLPLSGVQRDLEYFFRDKFCFVLDRPAYVFDWLDDENLDCVACAQ